MGWSCRAEAGKVIDSWRDACVARTGSQNTFRAFGCTYFWEISRTEHADGAITGAIWRMLPGTELCRRASTFRIEGDGSKVRAPKYMLDALAPV